MLRFAAIVLSSMLMIHPAHAADGDGQINVSMIQLIANPEKFDGKKVVLTGFMNLEFEGDALYLHRDDFLHRQMKNGLSLELSDKQTSSALRWSKQYVWVEGVFNARKAGHFGMYSGSIEQITRITGSGKRTK